MSLATLKAKIAPLGLSPHGEKWLTQALYPPGDLTRVAIPTRTHYPTLRIEFRPSTVISAPGPGNWDLLLFAPPGDTTAVAWAAGPTGTDFNSATVPAGITVGYIATVPNLSPVATNVQYVSRNPAGAGTVTALSTVQNPLRHMGFRLTAKSYTAHMTASDLYNSGTVTTAQYDTRYYPTSSFDAIGSRVVVPCLGSVPLTEDEITSSSPYAVVSPAKDGVFVPMRLMGPTFAFQQALPAIGRTSASAGGSTLTTVTGAASSLTMGAYPIVTTSTGLQSGSVPWWVTMVWGGAIRPDDSNFDAVTTGVSIFRGLNEQATITVISHVSMECILQVESPFRTLVGDPDEPDTRAINAYFEIAARMPHAYPASYNALGLVLPAIATAIRAVLPHLPKIWQGVKAVAPVVAPFLSGLLTGEKAEEHREAGVQDEERRLARSVRRSRFAAGLARPSTRSRTRAAPRQRERAKMQRIFAPPPARAVRLPPTGR